jgi:hypothetical protein
MRPCLIDKMPARQATDPHSIPQRQGISFAVTFLFLPSRLTDRLFFGAEYLFRRRFQVRPFQPFVGFHKRVETAFLFLFDHFIPLGYQGTTNLSKEQNEGAQLEHITGCGMRCFYTGVNGLCVTDLFGIR